MWTQRTEEVNIKPQLSSQQWLKDMETASRWVQMKSETKSADLVEEHRSQKIGSTSANHYQRLASNCGHDQQYEQQSLQELETQYKSVRLEDVRSISQSGLSSNAKFQVNLRRQLLPGRSASSFYRPDLEVDLQSGLSVQTSIVHPADSTPSSSTATPQPFLLQGTQSPSRPTTLLQKDRTSNMFGSKREEVHNLSSFSRGTSRPSTASQIPMQGTAAFPQKPVLSDHDSNGTLPMNDVSQILPYCRSLASGQEINRDLSFSNTANVHNFGMLSRKVVNRPPRSTKACDNTSATVRMNKIQNNAVIIVPKQPLSQPISGSNASNLYQSATVQRMEVGFSNQTSVASTTTAANLSSGKPMMSQVSKNSNLITVSTNRYGRINLSHARKTKTGRISSSLTTDIELCRLRYGLSSGKAGLNDDRFTANATSYTAAFSKQSATEKNDVRIDALRTLRHGSTSKPAYSVQVNAGTPLDIGSNKCANNGAKREELGSVIDQDDVKNETENCIHLKCSSSGKSSDDVKPCFNGADRLSPTKITRHNEKKVTPVNTLKNKKSRITSEKTGQVVGCTEVAARASSVPSMFANGQYSGSVLNSAVDIAASASTAFVNDRDADDNDDRDTDSEIRSRMRSSNGLTGWGFSAKSVSTSTFDDEWKKEEELASYWSANGSEKNFDDEERSDFSSVGSKDDDDDDDDDDDIDWTHIANGIESFLKNKISMTNNDQSIVDFRIRATVSLLVNHGRSASITAVPDHHNLQDKARHDHDGKVIGNENRILRAFSAASPRRLSNCSVGNCQPPLKPSLFPNVPPTINFVDENSTVNQSSCLRWRMSTITPNVVKQCIARSGFKATERKNAWIGTWSHHMKPPLFKNIRDYQKINHFPGTFQIGRKDRLWRSLSKMAILYSRKEFNYFPMTYILPGDRAALKVAWGDEGRKSDQPWIMKPPAAARGIGISVINKWSEVPKKRPVIIQHYISRPLLVNGSKFDLRIYVHVTSYDPLRIYIHKKGLVRFASVKYLRSSKSFNNRYMHLTNYSINKKNKLYTSNMDENIAQGHKWSLHTLWDHLEARCVDTRTIWATIQDIVIKTIISSDSTVNSLVIAHLNSRYSVHELFGFDIILDDSYKPWLLEVNISPSLHSSSQLDTSIKGCVVRDVLNLAGFVLPDPIDIKRNAGTPSRDLSNYTPSTSNCFDRRLWLTPRSARERAKHSYYCKKFSNPAAQSTILDYLTPDDVRVLIETVDESRRCGQFERIFPSYISSKYLKFFDQPRYYNLLLDAWTQTNRPPNTARGIEMLQGLCVQNFHLLGPSTDTNSLIQWEESTSGIKRNSAKSRLS